MNGDERAARATSSVTRRALLAASALAPVAGVALARLVGQGPGAPRATGTDVTSPREAIRARYFPNVPLTTHQGTSVRFYDDLIKDKLVTINFMYTRCEDGRCPIITANLVQVQRLLSERVRREVFMYSITLKPEQDTVPMLQKYAQAHRVGPGWLFLTGRPDDIELLRRRLGFIDLDPGLDADRSNHIGTLRYGNEPLQLWAAMPGMTNPEWIAESISWVDRTERA